MAEWTTAYINDLPDGAFACTNSTGRHYPHHDSTGKIDLPHLRAAQSRIGDPDNEQCGKGHLAAHARAEGIGEAAGKALYAAPISLLKATPLDDDAFDLLAIPFGGPIPHPDWPRGVDLDGQTFTERSDIKADWFKSRLVDWHHGWDRSFGTEIIADAKDLRQEEDGWWVRVWLRKGLEHVDMVRRLAASGAPIFGSSETVRAWAQVAKSGEILRWPFMRQTLSPVARNTLSVPRPLAKADLEYMGPTVAFENETVLELEHLAANLLSGANSGPSGTDLADGGPGLTDAHVKALARQIERARSLTGDTSEHGGNPDHSG